VRIRNSLSGYAALMAGGITSLTSHSPKAGVLAGVATWVLAHLYGSFAPTPGSAAHDRAHAAGEDFRRRWHSLSDRT